MAKKKKKAARRRRRSPKKKRSRAVKKQHIVDLRVMWGAPWARVAERVPGQVHVSHEAGPPGEHVLHVINRASLLLALNRTAVASGVQ